MSNLTQMAIKEAFLQLLNERPFNKITVKDVVERCGINRNSFYYHYEDLPSLLMEIIRDQIEGLLRQAPPNSTPDQCLKIVTERLAGERQAFAHVYRFLDREMFESYLMAACVRLAENCVESFSLPPKDREILLRYYQCLLFGVMMDWFRSGMQEDMTAYLQEFRRLRQEHPEAL